MELEEYTEMIKQECTTAGTYRPYFDSVIATLAQILVIRDKALNEFEKGGSKVTIRRLTSQGVTVSKNPCLLTIEDMNKTALSYWRELGLTPVGLRRISEDAMKPRKKSALAEIMRGL